MVRSSTSRVRPPQHQPTVLLVDDDDDVRELVRQILEREGLPSVEARTGLEALDLAARVRPRIVILDLLLPRLRGEEVARRLRALYQDEVALIVLSGNADAPRVARRIGADACLGKPFEVSALLDAVSRAMSG